MTNHSDLASACSTTLVAEAHPMLHYRPILKSHLAALGVDTRNGYDLLAIPSFEAAAFDDKRILNTLSNIALAIDVHQAETVVLLAGPERKFREFSERLEDEKAKRFPKLKLVCGTLRVRNAQWKEKRKAAKRLVVTCMDFRLHRDKSLADFFLDPETSWLTYPGAAYAAVDPQTADIFWGDIMSVAEAYKVEEINVISHTDCAKYHGICRFKSRNEEIDRLVKDLRKTTDSLSTRLSGAKVKYGVAIVQDGRCVDLI